MLLWLWVTAPSFTEISKEHGLQTALGWLQSQDFWNGFSSLPGLKTIVPPPSRAAHEHKTSHGHSPAMFSELSVQFQK